MENNSKKVLLHIDNLKQYFPIKKGTDSNGERLYVKANDGISLDIYQGETIGLVGESGCGKSTFGRSLLQLYKQTDGRTIYYGRDIDEIAPKYVEEILKNLVSKKKTLIEYEKEEKKLKEQYDSLTNADEKKLHSEKLKQAQKRARDLFLDIVELIGGFYILDDLTEVSERLLKEYKASVEFRSLNEKLNDLTNDLEAKKTLLKEKSKTVNDSSSAKKLQSKIDLLKQTMAGKEKELQGLRDDIYNLMKKYKDKPEFAKYEAYRDKGINLSQLDENEMRLLRKDLQLIFQDPYSSLNPRMTVGQIISEGLLAHNYFHQKDERLQEYTMQVMEKCGLAQYFIHRYPHQFSGGQRQRIGIARSLALKPKFVVCDEAVSALDVSIQSQIINLLLDLKEEENLTYLFISHDLSVIKYISDRVGVMYLGNLVELAPTKKLYDSPAHPYTEALLSAIPTTDVDERKESIILEGDIPSPIRPPKGCKFHTRCRYCTDICKEVEPAFEEISDGHFVACHHKLSSK